MPLRTVDPAYIPVNVITAAGVPQSSPQATTALIPAGLLVSVDLQIPPGHHGLTGIRLTLAGAVILPYSNPASWIVGDDLQQTFAVNTQVDTQLRVETYNTGQYPHTHYLRFLVQALPSTAGVPRAAILSANAIGGAQ